MEARRMQVSRVIFAAQDTGEPISASPSGGNTPVKWCGEPGLPENWGAFHRSPQSRRSPSAHASTMRIAEPDTVLVPHLADTKGLGLVT